MSHQKERFLFPKWANLIGPMLLLSVFVLGGVATFGIWYYASPKNTDVGYQPKQPVPYSHKLHAGDLGMDCRYCHTNVEKSAVAGVPPAQTCMNCHFLIKGESPKLQPIRDSFLQNKPVPWLRIHKTPDYAYFNHSRHVTKGVGCVECHGRVDQMEVVRQTEPLSMGWCLECHRDAGKRLRPKDVSVTKMDWSRPADAQNSYAEELVKSHNVNPPTDCSGCHR